MSTQAKAVEGSAPPSFVIEVTAVVPASPAANAGLERRDIIVAVDGASVAAPKDDVVKGFGERIRALGAGTKVKVRIRRNSVSVQTFLDEVPQGPGSDASGPKASRRILPDLSRLLEQHPENLVTVRARSYAREREVPVVLGARPGSSGGPLPPNDSLRPGLAKLPLDPAGGLAQGVIQRAHVGDAALADVYEQLRERFDKDQVRGDAFRLNTMRYLHRDPLRLPLATRAMAIRLRGAFRPPRADEPDASGLAAVMSTARFHLDAVASIDTEVVPRTPSPGAAPGVHGAYAKACVALAERRVERALAGLNAEERTFLETNLPTLAEVFTQTIYLHTDDDLERWDRHSRAIKLLAKVDRGMLIWGVSALTPLADPVYLRQLRADLLAAEEAGASDKSSGGIRGRLLWYRKGVVIGSSEANEYRDTELAVVIDLGGDDRYHVPVGSGRPGRTAGVCIDLAGDDRYQTTVSHAFGAGFLGVGLLIDVFGNDHYTTNQSFAQGSALAGAGLLLDLSGDDVYRATAYAQGSALAQGLGALVDLGGDDLVFSGVYSQAFAGPGGFGCLLARGGNDRYSAVGREPCSYGDPGTYRSMSQGASVGFRHQASGGIAVLLDEGGRDTYEAGNFSQGGGYYFGWGALIDLGGEADRYEGSRYAQGFAAHSALGSMWEDGGDDIYRGWVGAQNSAAWDLSATCFLDDAGDDRYEPGPGFCLGASAHNGFSLFVDAGGVDTYRKAPGRSGPNDYHGGPSISVFIDAGGEEDIYRGGGLANNRASAQAGDGGQGHTVLLDLGGVLEDVDPDTLFPPSKKRE